MTDNADLLWIGSTEIIMNELRKEFNVPNTSPLKSAIVYMSGLGYYEFYLNGNKVDPSRKLDPGWTTFQKRTLLVSYDVTPNITVRHVSFRGVATHLLRERGRQPAEKILVPVNRYLDLYRSPRHFCSREMPR